MCSMTVSCAPPQPDPLVVTTSTGAVRGLQQNDTQSFRGIPFAAPPIGPLRWAPPAAAAPWPGVRDATAYGPACLQRRPTLAGSPGTGKFSSTSEDCLTLNINRPAEHPRPLPVIVWIHGGGFGVGSGQQATFNSPSLPQRGVLVVTANYRLGSLGFFAHPTLANDPAHPVANFGLADQIAALRWVQTNIAAFGGDPTNVTIMGESAGGTSVNALMCAPSARGLFAKAITQSGLGRERPDTIEAAQRKGQATATALHLDDPTATQLRSLPGQAVIDAAATNMLVGDAPILDDILPRPVSATFDAGLQAPVPYLIGTTDMELPDPLLRKAGIDPNTARSGIVGTRRATIEAAYPNPTDFNAHLISDAVFGEPARHLAAAHRQRAATFVYRFAIASPAWKSTLGGAPHSSDIAYVFGDFTDPPQPANARSLADTLRDYWASFAATGVPRAQDGPDWPTYGDDNIMEFTNDGPAVAAPDPWLPRFEALTDALTGSENPYTGLRLP